MSKKEVARSASSIAERAEPKASSNPYFTTGDNVGQGRITALLKHGANNAISTQELMQIAGCASVRQLQKQIEAERNTGALILSRSEGGYFLPDYGEAGRKEIEEYVRTLRARAINTLRTVRAAKAALRVAEGQLEVEQW